MKLITEFINDPLALLTESDSSGEKHLYIQGPFAVSEQKNKNGRIYKRDLMERVIDKYRNDFIKNRISLGEINHPCFSEDAKVFVENRGLIPISDVNVGDYVYGTTNDGVSKPTKVLSTEKNKFAGNLIKFSSRSFNATVTPYHRFYLKNRNGGYDVVTAQDILDDIETDKRSLSHSYIPKTLENWEGIDNEYIELNSTITRINQKEYAKSPLVIKMKDFCAFMGIYLSEGCVDYGRRKSGEKIPGEVIISQNFGSNFELMLDLISSLNVNKISVRSKKDGIGGSIIIQDNRLADYLAKFGDCYEKYVPNEILESTKENIAEFLDWYNLGDGACSYMTDKSNRTYTQKTIFTVSEKMADGLIECIVKIGKSTTKRIQLSKEDYIFAGRTIQIKNKVPLYRMTVGNSIGKYVDGRFIKTELIPHDDFVYCLVTESSNFFVEQSGSIFLSGNCRLSSDFERASHLTTEMTQDGNNWIGKARVLKTNMGQLLEGLLRSGVNVGVSTRGAGTLIESNGVKSVGNDYFMTAVDVVTDPSGPGCFVNGIMEGMEIVRTPEGLLVEQTISEIAKKEYDKKQLTESKMLELFQLYVNEMSSIK